MTSTKSPFPSNIIVRRILVTDLLQQLKKQRDFLKWMGRRHKDLNPDQSEAFFTGARLFDELRTELKEGLFDEEEVLTDEEALARNRRALQEMVDSPPRPADRFIPFSSELDQEEEERLLELQYNEGDPQ